MLGHIFLILSSMSQPGCLRPTHPGSAIGGKRLTMCHGRVCRKHTIVALRLATARRVWMEGVVERNETEAVVAILTSTVPNDIIRMFGNDFGIELTPTHRGCAGAAHEGERHRTNAQYVSHTTVDIAELLFKQPAGSFIETSLSTESESLNLFMINQTGLQHTTAGSLIQCSLL